MSSWWQAASIRKTLRAITLGLLVVALGEGHFALGGPPLVTDDPETPGRNGWEINLSHRIEQTRDGLLMQSPLFDINYGLLDNDQWKIEVPVSALDSEQTGSHWGVGDLLLGWKYRFLDEQQHGFMVSVYPQVLIPTGNASLGLGSGFTEAFFPFEIGKHFLEDKLFVYGEIGYGVSFGNTGTNHWKYGLAASWTATERLELMGEVGGFAFPEGGEPDDTFFNFGFRRRMTDRIALIASFGRSFHSFDRGTPDLLTFVGLQITRKAHKSEESEKDDEDSEAEATSSLSRTISRR